MKSIIFAIITAFIWGIVPVLEKLGLNKINPWVGLFYRCLGVSLGMVVLGLFFLKELKTVNPNKIAFLILGGLLASVIGQIFFYISLKASDVSKIVPIVGSYPLISFLLGIILLGENLTLNKTVAIVLIILGIWLISI